MQVPASTNVTTPVDEFTVQTEVVELVYVIEPAPADGVAVIVGAVALIAYGPESPESESVRLSAVMVKLIEAAVAAAYPPAAVISAAIVQVPASTKATKPVDELIVHIDVVELEYDFVPLPSPALAVEVIVGLVPALKAYEEVYEPASIVRVLDVAAATVMSIVGELAAL